MAADRVLKELEIFSERPAARSGHRSCATTNHILTYGGYDRDNNNVIYSEVLSFNAISKKWVELPGSKDIRGDSASCSMVLYGENLIVYGGSGFPFGHSNSDDLSAYSLQSKSWSRLRNDRGSPPLPNYGQSMVITTKNHAPKLYTFSGTIGREFLDDMHYYDLEKKVWYRIWGEDAPEARYRHEAVVFGDDFYIFGGATYGRTIGFENIWKFNFISHKWTKLECKPSEDGGVFPDSRKAHSCVLWKDTVYMCGGITNLTEPQNDIWKISLNNLVWEKVNIVSLLPFSMKLFQEVMSIVLGISQKQTLICAIF